MPDAAEVVAELHRRLSEKQRDAYAFPNPPTAEDYADEAEAMGLQVQHIGKLDVYDVWAFYAAEPAAFHGTEPVAVVLEDFSRSIWTTTVLAS